MAALKRCTWQAQCLFCFILNLRRKLVRYFHIVHSDSKIMTDNRNLKVWKVCTRWQTMNYTKNTPINSDCYVSYGLTPSHSKTRTEKIAVRKPIEGTQAPGETEVNFRKPQSEWQVRAGLEPATHSQCFCNSKPLEHRGWILQLLLLKQEYVASVVTYFTR